MSAEIINTRILETNKGARLWLEGVKLKSLGFDKGKLYSTKVTENSITLTLSNDGKKKVSGRTRNGESNPIIDLCGKWLSQVFDFDELVTARIENGKITIKRHKEGMAKKERELRAINEPILKEAALCYGIGVSAHAISNGLNSSNVQSEVSLIMERESKYLQVAKKNNVTMAKDPLVIHGDIEDVDESDLESCDIISLSLPCTGHSPAGKTSNKIKKAEDHKRDSTAIFGAIKVIYKTNPSVIISENVVQAQNSATYVLFKSELRRLGYKIFELILDESNSTALERRRRYWFVAMSENIAKGFSLEDINQHLPKRQFNNIGDILEDCDHNWFSDEYFKKREEVNKKKGRGFKCNFVNDQTEMIGVIPRNYTKRQISNPHFQAQNGALRLFTPKEHSRIKGIPEELIEGISATTAHEGLGQSILYSHAYIIAKAIGEHIAKIREKMTKKCLKKVS